MIGTQIRISVVAIGILIPILAPLGVSACQERSTLYIPQGISLTVEINSPISTRTNKKGDKFACRVLAPAEFRDAQAIGRIAKIKSSGRASGRAEFVLNFESIRMADGRSIKLSADVTQIIGRAHVKRAEKTENGPLEIHTTADLQVDSEGRIKAPSLHLRDAATVASGAVVGAVAGAASGGAGATAAGAAAGAGVGLLLVLLTKGPEVVLDSGTKIVLLTAGRSASKK